MRLSLPAAAHCGGTHCVRAMPMRAMSASSIEMAQLTIRPGQEDNELMQAARLRAEAYYEAS